MAIQPDFSDIAAEKLEWCSANWGRAVNFLSRTVYNNPGQVMRSTIRLFKAVPVRDDTSERETPQAILEATSKRRFVFSPEVVGHYSEEELQELVHVVEKEVGLTPEKMNSTFHKSFKKVRDADILQLVIEQLTHYFTTYGFQSLGIYSNESVYVPNEKLELPQIDMEQFPLVVINGYTKGELKARLLKLLQSGIALAEDTISDVVEVAGFTGISVEDLASINNREVAVILHEKLDLVPADPVEFLRYLIYRTTGGTLLIKNDETIELIKEGIKQKSRQARMDDPKVKSVKTIEVEILLGLFERYREENGLGRLAQIFYRFKPLFLAFRDRDELRPVINKLRRLATEHHRPMKEDYLNGLTARINRGETIDKDRLQSELGRVNVFRKIRLAYALRYRTKDVDSILYRIRNGKSYATGFSFPPNTKDHLEEVLGVILDSLIDDLTPKVNDKIIYIPDFVHYALPSTEKQFTGEFPSGTYVTITQDTIFGVHWEDVGEKGEHVIDLDLSLIDMSGQKLGWDGAYRSEDRTLLFSGDMTAAPLPNGATELFYVQKGVKGYAALVLLNYYNFRASVPVPYKIIVAQEEPEKFGMNYMVDPNKVVSLARSKIETYLGMSITAEQKPFVQQARSFFYDYYQNTISLEQILEAAGATIIRNKKGVKQIDWDLSPENLQKDTIIKLLTG
jgi:hypothetical protein